MESLDSPLDMAVLYLPRARARTANGSHELFEDVYAHVFTAASLEVSDDLPGGLASFLLNHYLGPRGVAGLAPLAFAHVIANRHAGFAFEAKEHYSPQVLETLDVLCKDKGEVTKDSLLALLETSVRL